MDILWCGACGTGTTFPPPSRDVTSAGLFDDGSYGGQRLQRQAQWLHEARSRLRWIRRSGHAPGSTSLLEIGAATGEFVAVASREGYATIGVETSRWAAEQAKALTPNVWLGDLSDWRAEHGGTLFDAVVLFHVLEHVHEPRQLLNEIQGMLRPGGSVFLEVPNGGSRDARRLSGSWPLALLDDHVHHFTSDGLAELLRSAGFSVQHVKEVSPGIYMSRKVYALRRLRSLRRGEWRGSRDLLRVQATS